jgi:hypothetical protein
MFHAEYSSGQPLCILVDLRTAVDAALAQATKKTSAPKAHAASAGSGFAVSSSDTPEFEVSSVPAWDADAADDSGDSTK